MAVVDDRDVQLAGNGFLEMSYLKHQGVIALECVEPK
jgi:hypothetical protein